jgi:uncharacterized protein with HEPN domain
VISDYAAKYLWDVQQAAQLILQFTVGRTFDDYLDNVMLRSAVERQFSIIGEALARVRRVAPEIAAIIPDLGEITGFRNVLVHDYDRVDSSRVWAAIKDDLPKLLQTVTDLLPKSPEP